MTGDAVVDGRLASATNQKNYTWTSLDIHVLKIFFSRVFKELNQLSKWSNDFITITLINAFFFSSTLFPIMHLSSELNYVVH